jgi:hypothetical protein
MSGAVSFPAQRNAVLLGWAGMLDIDSGIELAESSKDAPHETIVSVRHSLLDSNRFLRSIVFPAQEDLDLLLPVSSGLSSACSGDANTDAGASIALSRPRGVIRTRLTPG